MKIFIFLACILFSLRGFTQNKNQILSPFKKERWFLGLAGNFSSNTNKISNSSSNNYGLTIKLGKFVKNRWLIGGIIYSQRTNSKSSLTNDFETFFIAPTSSYYLTKNKEGSLYLSVSPGYIRYREETFTETNNFIQDNLNGNGFGIILNIGYAYSFTDYIIFDIGLDITNYWLRIENKSFSNRSVLKNENLNGVNFSFGFNILLDNLF